MNETPTEETKRLHAEIEVAQERIYALDNAACKEHVVKALRTTGNMGGLFSIEIVNSVCVSGRLLDKATRPFRLDEAFDWRGDYDTVYSRIDGFDVILTREDYGVSLNVSYSTPYASPIERRDMVSNLRAALAFICSYGIGIIAYPLLKHRDEQAEAMKETDAILSAIGETDASRPMSTECES